MLNYRNNDIYIYMYIYIYIYHRKCYVCKQSFLSPCSKFSSHHSKQVFPINKYITCQSNNLIYLMECRTCKQSYVGYATANLPKRFSNHKSHIKKGIRS